MAVNSLQTPFLEERRQEILLLLQEQGRVGVIDLSRRFGVSEVTIRADLQALADERLVVRTHGGSISAEHGIGTLKRDWLHYSRSEAELALMRALKQTLEPKSILNPGKML